MAKKVSVIIPTRDGIKTIGRCLSSIKKQSYKNWEAIVIDDGSNDGTVEFVKKRFKNFKMIVSKQGVAANRNIGIYNSSGEYIVMIDDDAYLNKDWIKIMVEFMEKNQNVALAEGKILLDKNRIFSTGVRISKMGNGYDIGYGESSERYKEVKRRHYANTTTLIARKSMIEKVGYFDKMHYFGYEDMDLGWRCNIAGFDVVYNPKAISYHPKKALVCREKDPFWRTYVWRKTKTLTYLKNYELKTLMKLAIPLFGVFLFNLIFKKDRIQTLKGHLWNLFNIRHIIRERKKINRIRKRSDKELFKMLKWSFK